MNALRFKRLDPWAISPRRAEPGSVGYDLCACLPKGSVTLFEGERQAFETGLAMAFPPGTYGRIAGRSGLAVESGIGVLAGVIDPSYRGEIKPVLVNHGYDPVVIRHGQRIAQLVLERYETPDVVEVGDLGATGRGVSGFGSTGE